MVTKTKTKKAPIGNAAQVAAAKPGVHKIAGAEGLYLKKTGSGAGSWFYRYRIAGDKKREMGLGSIAHISLADARLNANELTVRRAKGTDPKTDRDRERREADARQRAEARKVTFAEAAEAYVDERSSEWRGSYARRNWINPLIKYAYPVIGRLLLDDIDVEHIRAVIKVASKLPGGTARRVRQRIEQILDDAVGLGLRSAIMRNPADVGLHRGIGRKQGEKPHYQRLELDDAPAVFRRLLEGAETSTAISTWVFMIATAARGSEALKARWGEIDLAKKSWTIPAARMKNNRKHVVPLSSLALAILERQARVRSGDAVFPGSGGAPLSYNAFAVAAGKAGVDAGTPHSWRSVFRDACGDRLRVDRDLAEAALSHTLGAVEGAYRRETAIEARRPVMESYANWLLDEGAEVLAFPPRAG
jgi:integrase